VTTDRGRQFSSAVWSTLCQRLNIQHIETTAVLCGGSLRPPATSGGRVRVPAQGRGGFSLDSFLPGSLPSPREKPEVPEPQSRRPNRGGERGQAQAPPRQGSSLSCCSSTTRLAQRPGSSSDLRLTLRPLQGGGGPVEERIYEAEMKKSASIIVIPI
jgi:hypothetical protein